MSTTPIFHPARGSTSSSRWHQPTERPEPRQPHRLTRVCALAPRLPQLFNHRAKAAQVALCRTEKPSVVCRHSSSTRSCSDGGKGSRAAAWATCSAAAAAPRLRTSPQWAGGPAIAFVLSVWRVVALVSSRAVVTFFGCYTHSGLKRPCS